MCRTQTTKAVSCPDCGETREIRSDSTASLCRRCSGLRGSKAPKRIHRTGRNESCRCCGKTFWWRPSSAERRFCSPACANARKKRKDKPAKIYARAEANKAKARGDLKPKPCETCGKEPTEMHHDDYGKPLEVRWLCQRCHVDLHVAQGDLKATVEDHPAPA